MARLPWLPVCRSARLDSLLRDGDCCCSKLCGLSDRDVTRHVLVLPLTWLPDCCAARLGSSPRDGEWLTGLVAAARTSCATLAFDGQEEEPWLMQALAGREQRVEVCEAVDMIP